MSKGDVLEQLPNSAKTGRTLDEIASRSRKTWHTNRSSANKKSQDNKTTRILGTPPKANPSDEQSLLVRR